MNNTDPEETALNLVLNYIFRDSRQKKIDCRPNWMEDCEFQKRAQRH